MINNDINSINNILNEMAYGLGEGSEVISQDAAIKILQEAEKGTPKTTFTAMTEPKCRKTNNPFLPVRKIVQATMNLGASYQNYMDKKMEKIGGEVPYEVGPRSFGEHASKVIIEYNGNYYVQIVNRNITNILFVSKYSGYWKLMNPSEEEKLKNFMTENTNQDYRNYKIENILAFKLNKKEYRIQNSDPDKKQIMELPEIQALLKK